MQKKVLFLLDILISNLVIYGWNINANFMNENLIYLISNIIVVAFYYLFIIRLKMHKKEQISIFKFNTFTIIILALCCILSISILSYRMPLLKTSLGNVILSINMFCIILMVIHTLHFNQFTKENEKLKMKLHFLEKQFAMQYSFYTGQETKCKESLKILHDVNKHIKIIEQLYQKNETIKALEYTREISGLLNPIIPNQYTDHIILNILLNEMENQAINKGISMSVHIGNINLHFMNPIEITVIFGNLLENAIEACEKIHNLNPFIDIKVESFNSMIVVYQKNSCNTIQSWKNKKPVSAKLNHKGIGLINIEKVINKYSGSMILKEENRIFYCQLMWSG